MSAKSITIRKVPEPVHRHWRVRAARNGRSLEAELRAALMSVAKSKGPRQARDIPAKAAVSVSAHSSEIPLTEAEVSDDNQDALKRVRNILRRETEELTEVS
ncbi:MAG: plasmid stability protein stbC [Pseudomonadota bacterium]